jgi:hypothetical protein
MESISVCVKRPVCGTSTDTSCTRKPTSQKRDGSEVDQFIGVVTGKGLQLVKMVRLL